MSTFMAAVDSVPVDLNLRVVLQDALRDAKLMVGSVDGEDGLRLGAEVLDQARSIQIMVTGTAMLVSVLHDGEDVLNRPGHDSTLLTSLPMQRVRLS